MESNKWRRKCLASFPYSSSGDAPSENQGNIVSMVTGYSRSGVTPASPNQLEKPRTYGEDIGLPILLLKQPGA